jgi:hypothetical protein
MTHPDADTLLKFVLQTLEESDEPIIREHLAACDQCRELQQNVQLEIQRLGRINLPIEMPAPPRLHGRLRVPTAVLRLAAVLAVGFLMGYATAQFSEPVSSVPVQQRLIPVRVAVPSSGYIPCQAVDLKTMRPG